MHRLKSDGGSLLTEGVREPRALKEGPQSDSPRGRVGRFEGGQPWAPLARVAILATADGVALLLAGVAAFHLWAQPIRGQDPSLYLAVAPGILLPLVGYGFAGLYPGFGLGPVEVFRRYVLVTLAAFLVAAALVFGLKLEDQYSRVTLAIAFIVSLVLIGALRWATTRWARRFTWWPEPVVLIGRGKRTALAQRLLVDTPNREFRPVAILDPEERGEENGDPKSPGDQESRGVSSGALALVSAGVETAFVDVDGPGSPLSVDRLRLLFPRVIILRAVEGLPVEGVQVRNLGGVLALEYGNNLLRRQSRWMKRLLDLVVAATSLLLTLPILLLAMTLVRVLSPGPVLFRQPREGLKGRTIQVPKIRTMVTNAEDQIEALLRDDPNLREEWENGFKLQHDPRVIPVVGRPLRRFSVDELPQLSSVLRGEMSLVGPRPFPAYHLDALSEQARHLRRQVRPGITGLWQVTARGEADVEAQQAYDLYYIRNWSIWLDLYILARTVSAVVSGRGAY